MKFLSKEEIDLIYILIKRKKPGFSNTSWFYFPIPKECGVVLIHCHLCEKTFAYNKLEINTVNNNNISRIVGHARFHLKESNLMAFL